MNETLNQARADLAAAFRWAARLGYHESVGNHFTCAVNDEGTRFLVNPWGRERSCQHQVMAMSTGRPLRLMSDEVARQSAEQWHGEAWDAGEQHFAALKRILDREEPDYAH